MSHNELLLYAENDGDLYRSHVKPLYRNLVVKMKAGTYSTERAVKAFEGVATAAARKYQREIERRTFSASEKRATAKGFVDYFESEFALGNMKF